MSKPTFIVTSSLGTICSDSITGRIIYIDEDGFSRIKYRDMIQSPISSNRDPYFCLIKKFDIEEYKKFYNTDSIPESVDILDFGYWWFNLKASSGNRLTYEEPAHDWRILTNELRQQSNN